MKHHTGIITAMAAGVLLSLGVQAAAPAPVHKADATTAAAAKDTAKSKSKSKADEAAARCEYITGSRIRRDPPVDCEQMPGVQSHSADELRATGELNLSDALRKLDPRLQ